MLPLLGYSLDLVLSIAKGARFLSPGDRRERDAEDLGGRQGKVWGLDQCKRSGPRFRSRRTACGLVSGRCVPLGDQGRAQRCESSYCHFFCFKLMLTGDYPPASTFQIDLFYWFRDLGSRILGYFNFVLLQCRDMK